MYSIFYWSIDFRKLIGNTLLCIEVDENQHNRYDNTDEEIRYDDLFMVHGGKFVFIRFNPDKYVNRHNTKVNPYIKKRMERLSDEIIYQSNRIVEDRNEQLVDIVYLFYDKFD
jgi:very-short-patch-repair endonuclease